MTVPRIPPRNPIGDTFAGLVITVDGQNLLTGKPHSGTEVLREGLFIIRYGVVFLGKPHLSIVPGLLALDYGEFLTGEEAWEFLLGKSNLYPRADVVGYRNDGEDDMVVVKALDLVHPVDVLAYNTPDESKPFAKIEALILSESDYIAPRLLKYLKTYPSIDVWRKTTA